MSDAPQLDFYAQRRKLDHEDKWDTSPARRPYPDAAPDFSTKQGNPTDTPCHVRALHTHQRMVHEGAILIEGGDLKYLQGTKKAIRHMQAVQEELGTGVVTLTVEAYRVLGIDEPEDKDPRLTDVGY